MSTAALDLAAIRALLPEPQVGTITAAQPISTGLSGAGVYALSSTRGELVLRVHAARADAAAFTQQLRLLRRVAERGIAPALVHVDEAARAIVSTRVAGVPFAAALGDPAQRGAAIAGVVAQLRALHALDADGVQERDPLAHARDQLALHQQRPGFPARAATELPPIFDAIEGTLARDPRRVVSHNDVNPGNVLWDGARAWLVDWDVAGLSHPFYDLAALAMFLQLPDEAAHGLLALQEQQPIDDAARAFFAALRQLAALLCGLVLLGLLPDLTLLPSSAPTLSEFYAGLRTGAFVLQEPRGQAAFASALLALGLG
jgi:aminoglycoside phosphotransferase (APT) family kinase protein